jgi:hypothetical protein
VIECFAPVGLDRVITAGAAADTGLEVLKVPCSASYQFPGHVEEGIDRAVIPVQIHKEDTEAEVSYVVVVGNVGVEEKPDNWVAVARCKSFLQHQDCWVSEK